MFFFDLRLDKRLSKQSWGWWFETLSRPLWRHSNGWISYDCLSGSEVIMVGMHELTITQLQQNTIKSELWTWYQRYSDSKVHGANMGLIWGRQGPGGPHVGPVNFVIWIYCMLSNVHRNNAWLPLAIFRVWHTLRVELCGFVWNLWEGYGRYVNIALFRICKRRMDYLNCQFYVWYNVRNKRTLQ